MNFADALEAVFNTNMAIQREGWNGKGMFVYAVQPNKYPATTEVAKRAFEGGEVPYGGYLAIKAADGSVYPWTPSQADIFANDWTFA